MVWDKEKAFFRHNSLLSQLVTIESRSLGINAVQHSWCENIKDDDDMTRCCVVLCRGALSRVAWCLLLHGDIDIPITFYRSCEIRCVRWVA